MYILSTEEMSNIDKRAIEEFAIPGEVLMENAGKAVADKTEKCLGDMFGKKVLVVCGKGNNGGDGYVVARHMHEKGARVYVIMCASKDEITGDAKIMLERLPAQIRLTTLERVGDIHFDVAVDAVFGTGFKGRIDSRFAKVIETINKCAGFVVAVDIPSGVNGNTGAVSNPCVQADYTFTFCCEKLGHRIYPGKGMCGKTIVCDIGIPDQAVLDEKPKTELFTKNKMDAMLRPFSPMDHKGINGKLLIIGGSTGMTGSVCMAAMAAMRAGVGLCYVAVPRSVYPIVATKLTEAIIIPVEDNQKGCIAPSALEDLKDILTKVDAVVIGCGMSVTEDTRGFMYNMSDKFKTPVLIDADGLNIISKNMDCLYNCDVPVVLTPHMMEMARLLGAPLENVMNDRAGTAKSFAKDKRVTLVLKGDGTITAYGNSAYINTSGNPGMATGGSGDVLSGIIGAFLAGGMKPFSAAACGVFLHGMAGDYAAEQMSMRGMIATDIINALPYCFTAALPAKGASSLLEKRLAGKEISNIHRIN